MAEDIDPMVIKKTQEILGSVIKKPPLTEKSLKKPPFRFLHDIITNVIKSTGFMKDLYASEELQSENVKDKDSKIAFLQKAIDVLEIVNNLKLAVRPTKIVTGHEPQKTNEFLQLLGSSAKNKLDSKEAVRKIVGDKSSKRSLSNNKERKASIDKKASSSQKLTLEKPSSRSSTKSTEDIRKISTSSLSETKSKDADKSHSRSKDAKLKERGQSKERKRGSKTEEPKDRGKKSLKEKPPRETPKKEPKSMDPVSIPLETSENKENGHAELNEEPVVFPEDVLEPVNGLVNGDALDHEERYEEAHIDVNTSDVDAVPATVDVIPDPIDAISAPIEREQIEPDVETPEQKKPVKKEKSRRPPTTHAQRPPSAKSIRTRPDEERGSRIEGTSSASTSNNTDLSNSSTPTRPLTASRPPSARPPSARPAPPKIRIRHIVDNEEPSIPFRPPSAKPIENVVFDASRHSDEEDEAFVVSEEKPKDELEPELFITKSLPVAETPEEEQGSLVKQLLETKKDLEGGSQQPTSRKVEIDKSQMTDAARKRERESSGRELELLRSFIQTVSRTANPLGRMLDYLQEDVDAMKGELRMWKEENRQNVISLRREQSVTETALEPLRVQLDDLELQVHDQLETNSMLKSTIFRNDERIQRMLMAINNRS